MTSRRLVPFEQRVNGAIVSEDLEHECLAHLARRFGKKLVRLVVTKKREMEVYCANKLSPVTVRHHPWAPHRTAGDSV